MNNKKTSEALISFTTSKVSTSKKIFCFPHAGGGASFFKELSESLNRENLEVISIQLPGKENRITEDPYENLDDTIIYLYKVISDFLYQNPCDFYFLGHSMGSVICYELSLYLFNKNQQLPKHLFLSSFPSPNNHEISNKLLTDSDVISKLKNLNGTPHKILERKEFLDVFLPAIKADFNIVNSYGRKEPSLNLPVPITAFLGSNDTVTSKEILDWKYYTSKNFKYQIFKGDHFYIKDNIDTISESILSCIQ